MAFFVNDNLAQKIIESKLEDGEKVVAYTFGMAASSYYWMLTILGVFFSPFFMKQYLLVLTNRKIKLVRLDLNFKEKTNEVVEFEDLSDVEIGRLFIFQQFKIKLKYGARFNLLFRGKVFGFKNQKQHLNKITDFLRSFSEEASKFDIKELLEMKDKNKIIIQLDNYICKLCSHGKSLEMLNDCQKKFYFNQELERAVNDEGFHWYFYNSPGEFARETVVSLKEIGAGHTANILQKAIDQFPHALVPKNQEKRMVAVDKISKKSESVWNKLDQKLYEYKDDLNSLNLEFVKKNMNQFAFSEKSKKAEELPEFFAGYKGVRDRMLVIAFINMAARDYKSKDFFPWFFGISVKFKEIQGPGLPTSEDLEEINILEEKLQKIIEKTLPSRYIGRSIWNGARESIFYTTEPKKLAKKLNKIITSKKERSFAFTSYYDPAWESLKVWYRYYNLKH